MLQEVYVGTYTYILCDFLTRLRAPSYRLDLDPKNKIGKMSMKSVIINDAQDLNADEVKGEGFLGVILLGHVCSWIASDKIFRGN